MSLAISIRQAACDSYQSLRDKPLTLSTSGPFIVHGKPHEIDRVKVACPCG